MSRLGVKRNFDYLMQDNKNPPQPQCSPHRIQFLQSPCPKRIRRPEGFDQIGDGMDTRMEPESKFVLDPINIDEIVSITAKKLKKKEKKEEKDELYPLQQVKKIVNELWLEREKHLRKQYDEILNRLLREQFENFTKFNQDYIHRQFARTDCPYLS